jgi:hypothetical protein
LNALEGEVAKMKALGEERGSHVEAFKCGASGGPGGERDKCKAQRKTGIQAQFRETGTGKTPLQLGASQIQRKVVCPPGVSQEDGEGCYEAPDDVPAPADQSSTDQSGADQSGNQSVAGQSTGDQSAADQSSSDQGSADKSSANQDSADQSSVKATVPLKQAVNIAKYPVDVNYATLEFSVAVEVSAEVEAASEGKGEGESGEQKETTVTPIGFDSGAVALAVGRAWVNKDGVNILGWDTAFTEVKLEGGVKVDKGFKVNLEGSGKLACGVELKLELTLVKIEDNWDVKGPGVEISAELPNFPFDVDIGMGVKLKDVQVHPILKVEVEPNYKRILGDVAKDLGEEAVGEQAAEKAGEVGTALLGADAVIIGGILLAGAGSIGAAILTIQEGDEIAETHGKCVDLAGQLTEGFRIGVVGGPPPGEKEKMPGYTQGITNFNSAVAKLKQQNPNVDDAAIRTAITAQADAVTAQAQPQIMEMAKDTVWTNYASNHQDKWYHSYDYDRWLAWSNIYGDDPRGDPRYTRFCPDHKCEHGM